MPSAADDSNPPSPHAGGACAPAASAGAPAALLNGEEKIGHYFRNPRSYIFGIHGAEFFNMVIGSLILLMLPCLKPPPMDYNFQIYWKTSLRFCCIFFFLTLCLSRTWRSVAGMFLSISSGPQLALALHAYMGPAVGSAVVHLATAWVAGHAGYALAVHRLEVGSEQAVIVADFVNAVSVGKSKEEKENQIAAYTYLCLMVGFVTLLLGVLLVCLIINMPQIDQEDINFAMSALSIITWVIIYFWTIFMARHETLMPVEVMLWLLVGFPVSLVLGFPLIFVSQFLWAYYFAIEAMAMAILFGYMLAINVRCQDPPEEKDTEA